MGVDTLIPIMLSPVDRAIIDLECTWWQVPGTKESAIVEEVGMTPADYYGRLTELIGSREAERYDPLTIRRLRRLTAS